MNAQSGAVVTLEELAQEDLKRAQSRSVAKATRRNRKGF